MAKRPVAKMGMDAYATMRNKPKMAHPGFKAVQKEMMEKEGVGKEEAGAMLAASTKKASPAAKKKNPRLKRVKG